MVLPRTIRPTFLLLLVLASALCVPAQASAASSPYGHLRITYRNASTYKWQVTEAFAVWNRAGTPFTFAPARPGTRADITVTQKPYFGSPSSSVAGYGGIGFVQLSAARLRSPKGFTPGQVKIVAHEIGHALGLSHVANPCALMYSAMDYPSRRCTIVERTWDGREFCGPRGTDVLALGRRWRFTPRTVAWRGYCTVPTDASRIATRPVVAGTLAGSTTQFPFESESGGVTVTVANTGNTTFDPYMLWLVLVDANGAMLRSPWSFGGMAVDSMPLRTPPAPGASTEVRLNPCTNATMPYVMRVRLASKLHDALVSPVFDVRVDTSDGDPSAPAGECISAAA